MKVIKTIPFQTGMLLSSNTTETVANWDSATTYSINQEVNYSNSIYVSLVGSNLNNQPATPSTFWIRKSANNKYSMFDEFVNTQSTRTSPLIVSVDPGGIFNSVAFFNLDGVSSINIVVTDGVAGPEVYNQTYTLDDTVITDWYMYFFEPYDLRTDLVITNLPPYANGVMQVTFTGSATVSVGNMVFGTVYSLGDTRIGAASGIRDYSVKEVNTFGITTLVQRTFSKRMSCSIFVSNSNLRAVQKTLSDIRATPSVWIGVDDSTYDVLSIFGYYKDFNIEITYPSYSLCSLEVEGLV